MKNLRFVFFTLALLLVTGVNSQVKNIDITKDFDKVIISPHIAVDFVQGANASIVVNDITEPIEKFNYEVKGGTLHVYLEGAKSTTKNKKVYYDGWKQKVPIYKNTVARITITYRDVNIFSLRGEEKIAFTSPVQQEELTLRIYGESEITISEVNLEKLSATIYGASNLAIEKGIIDRQRYTAYGESTVSAENVESKEAKVTVYGDGTFKLNVSDYLKVTAYGEADVLYKGNPEVSKGIVLGEANISRISR